MSNASDHSDGAASTSPSGDGAIGSGSPVDSDVSLLDVLLVLVRNGRVILRTILVFALVGGAYALLLSAEYTSEARVVQESDAEGQLPGGLASGALSGLGIRLGGSGGGLTPSAYPSVMQSREVRLAVARDTFQFPDVDRPMTFVEYANRPPGLWDRVQDYTVWLPWTITNAAYRVLSADSTAADSVASGTGNDGYPSRRERRGARAVKGKVTSQVESESGLMTIVGTADSPELAADLTKSFVDHLTRRVREIRTEKMRRQLDFVEARFEKVEKELEASEAELAQFLERNQNPTTATLQFRRDRLQRQVRFKEQLYSDLQSQLTQTRLDLQRRQPVVTVVEKPVPPREPSGPNRWLYFFAAIVLGGGCAVGFVLLQTFLTNWADQSEEGWDKIRELQETLLPRALSKRIQGGDNAEEAGISKSERMSVRD